MIERAQKKGKNKKYCESSLGRVRGALKQSCNKSDAIIHMWRVRLT